MHLEVVCASGCEGKTSFTQLLHKNTSNALKEKALIEMIITDSTLGETQTLFSFSTLNWFRQLLLLT